MPSPQTAAEQQSKSDGGYRYERKFRAIGVGLAHVELIVKLHPAHFREAFPPRYINNIYFDGLRLSDYAAHIAGLADRSKLRLRWYGAPRGRIERPALEIKTKRGYVGNKPTFHLGAFELGQRLDYAGLCRNAAESEVPGAVLERLARSSPALFNRYHRRYLISADGRYRLTIDTGLGFRAVPGRPLGLRGRHDARNLIVIELKYAHEYNAHADHIAGGLPFRLDKLSKYLHGIQALSGLTE